MRRFLTDAVNTCKQLHYVFLHKNGRFLYRFHFYKESRWLKVLHSLVSTVIIDNTSDFDFVVSAKSD